MRIRPREGFVNFIEGIPLFEALSVGVRTNIIYLFYKNVWFVAIIHYDAQKARILGKLFIVKIIQLTLSMKFIRLPVETTR